MTEEDFNKLTETERSSISDEDWKAIPGEIKKSCHDCAYLYSALSWWCGNKEAHKYRGTNIPGGCKCPYWKKESPKPLTSYQKMSAWLEKMSERILGN
jgi:hypothetical protein